MRIGLVVMILLTTVSCETTDADAIAPVTEDTSIPEAEEEATTTPAPPFQEVFDAGITQYLGLAAPTTETEADGVVTYEWDPADGPMCLRGGPYRMAVRDSAASDDLLIFPGGGGACWSDFCFAFEAAGSGIPPMQALDPDKKTNPFRDFDVAFLHYCDGSPFAGEAAWTPRPWTT